MLKLYFLKINILICDILHFLLHVHRVDDARQPLSRVVPIPSNQLNLYRLVIICRLIILCFFFQYRVTHPVPNAYPLWLTSVICEFWFAVSWLLDQFPKWYPINRETYLDRLALRFLIFFPMFSIIFWKFRSFFVHCYVYNCVSLITMIFR